MGRGRRNRVSDSGLRRWLLVVLLLGLSFPTPVAAQTGQTRIDLTRPASQLLLHLQEAWLQWMSAFYQDRPDEAASELEDLEATRELLGFERLPELSIGAVVRAVESARQGNTTRASWALDTAEVLDDGRPEIAFGRSITALEEGDRLRALTSEADGYVRIFDLASPRLLVRMNSFLFLVAGLLLAGGLFVAVQMAVKGGELYRSLAGALGRRLPGLLAHLLTVVALLWPLLLPGGPIWLLLFWSILLWGFGSVSERVVLTGLWIVAGAAPLLVSSQQQRIAVELSPPSHAMYALSEGRLYGGIFTDLGVLLAALPEEPAVHELVGDVHRRLGQWERARGWYVRVLEVEPENVTALVNVGAYYFRKGDYGTAVQYFQRAATTGVESPAAYYNLSQAYSESYLFDEQKEALAQARAIGNELVSGWIRAQTEDRVVTFDGGIRRHREIRRALASTWAPAVPESLSIRPYVSVALPVVAFLLAFVFLRIHGGSGAGESITDGAVGRCVGVVVPGLGSSEEGRGGRAYFSLFLVTVLVLLLGRRGIGYDLPLGLEPLGLLPVTLGVIGLVAFYGVRTVSELRSG